MPNRRGPRRGNPGRKSSHISKKHRKPQMHVDGDDIYDVVDKFAQNREAKLLTKDLQSSSDEEGSFGMFEMDPDIDASSSDDVDDDEEFDLSKDKEEEERAAYEAKREKDIAIEKNISKAWGKKKRDYYSTETEEYEIMLSDEEDIKDEEEQESRRLQREKAEQMEDDDFGGTDLGVLDDEFDGRNVVPHQGKKSKKKKKKKIRTNRTKKSDGDLLQALNADLDDIDLDRNMVQVEKVEKDLKELGKNDKLQIVLSDSPELLGMMEEFKEKIDQLRNEVQPVIQKVQTLKLPSNKGISLLQVKFHLLLNYCTNLAFFLLLKAEGCSIKQHPVVNQLVHIRTILEKIKPLEKKMNYQIQKLISGTAVISGRDFVSSTANPSLLSFKPAPGNFDGAEDDEDFESMVDNQANGVYKPPRIAATAYDEDERANRKRLKKLAKAKEKAARSSMVRHLRNEFLDVPETVEIFGQTAKDKPDHEEKERIAFEEDTFQRLNQTTAEIKKKKRKERQRMDAFDDFDDFRDLEALSGANDLSVFGFDTSSSLSSSLSSKKSESSKHVAMDILDDDELAAGLKTYGGEKRKAKRRRVERDSLYPIPESSYGDVDPDRGEGKRKVGRDIMQNRGLTRKRPKSSKNPRVKNRAKYDKALIKRRSQVQEFSGSKAMAYAGEATGIKKSLTRSTKL